MSVFWNYLIFTLFLLASAGARSNQDVSFRALQGKVLSEWKVFSFSETEGFIKQMIELIETGEVSQEAQGQLQLEKLKAIVQDCQEDSCEPVDFAGKMRRLSSRITNPSNLASYSRECQKRIIMTCAPALYQRVQETLRIDQNTEDLLNALSEEAVSANVYRGPRMTMPSRPETVFQYLFDRIVVKAAVRSDPELEQRIMSSWVNKGGKLVDSMEKIRSACNTFLDQIDPLVEQYPYTESLSKGGPPEKKLAQMHYRLSCCRSVVDHWKAIIKSARKNYEEFLS